MSISTHAHTYCAPAWTNPPATMKGKYSHIWILQEMGSGWQRRGRDLADLSVYCNVILWRVGGTGKRSLALGLQITARDDKRGPNKTQHFSHLNEMCGEGEWGKGNLLPKDILAYRFPRNAFHWPVELLWWKMWIQLGAVKVCIWINYNSCNNKT